MYCSGTSEGEVNTLGVEIRLGIIVPEVLVGLLLLVEKELAVKQIFWKGNYTAWWTCHLYGVAVPLVFGISILSRGRCKKSRDRKCLIESQPNS
uniref:Uncharacterized protein n=1 Tax=Anguilla anguilla TaxID=7936 RepID=A0A0E9QM99_ANGAN